MPTNQLAPPDMPWLLTRSPLGQPNGLGPPLLNYAAPPDPAAPTVGQGVAQTAANVAQALPSWPSVEEQRQMLQPLPGWQGTAVDAAKQWAEGVMMGTTAPGDVPPPGIVAYHGSPHSFDQFDTSKIGTGEGAQAYGHGLYFAEGEGVARQYRDVLASRSETDTPEGVAKFWANMQGGHEGGISHLEFVQRQIDQYPNNYPPGEADKINQAIQYLKSGGDLKPAGGHLYQVNIGADPEHFLDWDKPLSEQSQHVQDAVQPLLADVAKTGRAATGMGYADLSKLDNPTGANLQALLGAYPARNAEALRDAGIPGIKYLDQGSRSAGEGSHNFVVFDAATIDILKKYGIAGLIGSGAMAASKQQQ
jgi:hypothetical protein